MSDFSPTKKEFNTEGKPLRIHELDIPSLAIWLNEKKVRTTQGKLIQPLHKGHIEVLNDDGRFKVLACGRRWGKTLLTSIMALAVLMQVNRRVWIVAPDYGLCEKVFRELYNILVNQLKIIEPGKKGRARNQKGDYFLETPWGSVLEAKSLERTDSLAGEALDLVIVDEAALSPVAIDQVWTQMLRPTLMDKEGSAIFISTPRGRNGFYKLYLQGEKGIKQRQGKLEVGIELGVEDDMRDWSSFKKTSYDNPLVASTPEKSKSEIDAAKREAILAGKLLKFKQEYMADFEANSDIVFPGYIEESTEEFPVPNLVEYMWHPEEGPIFAACDHNYARPASTLFAQVNKYNDVVIFDELFTPHTTTFTQGQHILEKEKELARRAWLAYEKDSTIQHYRKMVRFQDIIADISGDQRQLNGRTAWDDIEAAYGKRPKGLKQDRQTGCDMIRLWLQFPIFDAKGNPVANEHGEPKTYPKLFINKNCTNLRYAIATAVFKKTKGGTLKEDYEETPEGYEGLLDALRYLLVYLFHDTGTHFTLMKGF